MTRPVRIGIVGFCTPEHAYHILEIMIKAQESGRQGQIKSIESSFALPTFQVKPATEPAHLVHDPRGRA